MTFKEFIASFSIIPPEFIEPGKFIRCATLAHPRKRNAGIRLFEDEKAGLVVDFGGMTEPSYWHADKADFGVSNKVTLTEIASRNRMRQMETEKSTNEAKAFFERCKPLQGGHPYLTRKELTMSGCIGLRVDYKGRLIVPMMDRRGDLKSIQQVDGDGSKLFWPGASTKGARYTMQRGKPVMTALCEGLATGLTLMDCLTDSKVIVCFNAANLIEVAKTLETSGLVCICADNDCLTEKKLRERFPDRVTMLNPGIECANAAAAFLKCQVCVPECSDMSSSDFNDWHQELMMKERNANLLRKRKHSDMMMRSNANAVIANAVMRAMKFCSV